MSLIRFRLGKLFPIVALLTLSAVTGCAASTMIQSQPPGARLFLNGVPVGVTPYTMTDTNMSGSIVQVRLEYPGFDPYNAMISRSEELDPLALIGGIFLLVPLLWVLKYQPVHYYQLQPAGSAPPANGWGAPPPQGYPPPAPGPAGYPPPPPQGYPPPAQQGYPPPQ
jgi:hypothetical protein